MISGKRVIAAMLTALMAVTFTANTAVSVYATGVTATENAQNIDAQSTDAQALTPEEQKAQELQQVYDMPVESNGYKDWPQGPGTYGEAGIVMEVGTGAILYAKNIDAHEYPASITKVLTALVALENGQLTDNVTFSHDSVAFLQRGDSSVGLKEGNVITLDQAMHAMLLASANEAAYAIGESVGVNAGHDYNWFIEQMNSRCKELGGENSNFANTNGLHDPNHYTCARDMALIGRELFKHPEFFKIVQTLNYTIPKSKTVEKHEFYQKHKMLWPGGSYYYKYAVGGKTGFTSDALATLITMAKKGDTKLVCVVMRTHGRNIFPDTRHLFDYAFKNFKKTPVSGNETSKDVGEILAEENSGYVMLPKGVKFSDLKMKMEVDKSMPSEATLTYTYRGNLVGSARAKLSQSYLDAHKAKVEPKSSVKNQSKVTKPGKTEKMIKNKVKKILPEKIWKQLAAKYQQYGRTKSYELAVLTAVLFVLILLFIARLIKMRRFKKKQKRKR